MQVTGRGEQHRRVPVVTAAVHPPVVARLVREDVFFLHRQSVHVGAKANRAPAGGAAARDDGDDAGAPDAGVILDAERRQMLADDLRGPVLLESELRVHVEIATHGREIRVPRRDVPDRVCHRPLQMATLRSTRSRGSTA